jgi:hypothetical protein
MSLKKSKGRKQAKKQNVFHDSLIINLKECLHKWGLASTAISRVEQSPIQLAIAGIVYGPTSRSFGRRSNRSMKAAGGLTISLWLLHGHQRVYHARCVFTNAASQREARDIVVCDELNTAAFEVEDHMREISLIITTPFPPTVWVILSVLVVPVAGTHDLQCLKDRNTVLKTLLFFTMRVHLIVYTARTTISRLRRFLP